MALFGCCTCTFYINIEQIIKQLLSYYFIEEEKNGTQYTNTAYLRSLLLKGPI